MMAERDSETRFRLYVGDQPIAISPHGDTLEFWQRDDDGQMVRVLTVVCYATTDGALHTMIEKGDRTPDYENDDCYGHRTKPGRASPR